MIYEHASYRTYLRATLAERIAKNPAYSLRAMARQLTLSPSFLSEILAGDNNLSSARALSLGRGLGLAGPELEYFQLQVQLEGTQDPELKSSLLERQKVLNPTRQPQDLSVDVFKAIADWYHVPILEMANLERFDFTPAGISQALGIKQVEAQAAVERLLRLELLFQDSAGKISKAKEQWLISSKIPNEALRKYHRQMLGKAIDSLETQTPKEKFIGSETFPFDATQLQQARGVIEECFSKLVKLAATGKKRKKIYHLGIQFFDLTLNDRKKDAVK